jgi:menaquinone-specific isochorismate synthase
MLMALKTAVIQLIDRLNQSVSITSPYIASLSLSSSFDALAWLSQQPIFPQFYWQGRDDHRQSVALGQHRVFSQAKTAEAFLTPQTRIWGGQGFNANSPLSGFFFLPLLELRQSDDDNIWFLQIDCQQKEATLALLMALTFDVPAVDAINACVLSQTHTPEFPEWCNLIDLALTAIDQTELQKVVLARRTRLTLSQPVSPCQLLSASREKNGDCFHFMMALDDKHCFLGSSPERLFWRDAQELKTEALAGTAGRSADAVEDMEWANWLLNDKKNRHENQLVVDDIISRLFDDCLTLTVKPTPELLQLRQVQHLKRPILGLLKTKISNSHLLQRLQPTAAIAGLPRQSAMDFLAKNEPFQRGWYSGAIGKMSLHGSEFCVALRSALWVDEHWHVFAGAGIVPGSEAQSEWQEINRKIATLYSLFVPQISKVSVNHE